MANTISEALLRRSGQISNDPVPYEELQSPPQTPIQVLNSLVPDSQSLQEIGINDPTIRATINAIDNLRFDEKEPFDTVNEYPLPDNAFTRGIMNLTGAIEDNIIAPVARTVTDTFENPNPLNIGKAGLKIASALGKVTPVAGILGQGAFNALNLSQLNKQLDDYGVPKKNQLGFLNFLSSMIPLTPSLQEQSQNILNIYNEGIMDKVRDDMFNAAYGNYDMGRAGRPGDPVQGSGIFSAGFPGDPAQGSGVSSDVDSDDDLGGYGGFAQDDYDGSTI